MKKRILAGLMALVLLITIIPIDVYDADISNSVEQSELRDWITEEEEQQLKLEIKEAVKNREHSLSLEKYCIKDDYSASQKIQQLQEEVMGEHAGEYCYWDLGKGYGGYLSDGIIGGIYFTYLSSTKEAELNTKISEAMFYIQEDMSDLEKAITLFDYVTQECTYEQSGDMISDGYSALVNGSATCGGYARAYQLLMTKAGIPCYYVSGVANSLHAWNQILIDNQWYYADPTWGDYDLPGDVTREYFLFSESKAEELNHNAHYTYEGKECISTIYDDSEIWWRDVRSKIIIIDDKQYYMNHDYAGVQLIERTGDDIKVLYQEDKEWRNFGSSGGYYGSSYAKLSYYDGYLYFNDRDSLYALDLETNVVNKLYEYTVNDGYIWGANVFSNGIAKISVSEEPTYQDPSTFMDIDLRMEIPNVLDNDETQIVATNSTMEYSLDNGNTWIECTDNMSYSDFGWLEYRGVEALFRTAAKDGMFASKPITVLLKALYANISGSVVAKGEETDETIIQILNASGEVINETTITGTNSSYELFVTEPGECTIRFSRKNHTCYEEIMTVSDVAISKNVTLQLTGDVNGDGRVNVIDKKMIYNHIAKVSTLTGYAFDVADVNDDGVVNVIDKKKIYNHIAQTALLWE